MGPIIKEIIAKDKDGTKNWFKFLAEDGSGVSSSRLDWHVRVRGLILSRTRELLRVRRWDCHEG